MDDRFQKVEREYYRLQGRFATGRITRDEFKAGLEKLMIQDSQGRCWMLGLDDAKWYTYDGRAWIEAQLPSELSQSDAVPQRSILFLLLAPSILLVLCLGGLIAILYGGNQNGVQVSTGYTPPQTPVATVIPPFTFTSTPTLASTPTSPSTSPATLVNMPTSSATLARTQTSSPTARMPTLTPTRMRTPTLSKPTIGLASFGCPGTQGSRLFFDDFSNPQSGWMPYGGTDYEHFYENGEFHFSVSRKNFNGNAWLLLRDLGEKYRIEIQARRLSGPELNDYGVIFGGQNDVTYDSILVSDAGSYRVVKQIEGQRYDLAAWTQTPFVRKTGWNFVGLRVENSRINFCLNGQVLTTITDPTLKSGRVGVIAGAFDEPAQIHFDNFGVWKID